MEGNVKRVYEDLQEVYAKESNRPGVRSGLEFMITQVEYEGTWKLN